jgi:hypothetical protein
MAGNHPDPRLVKLRLIAGVDKTSPGRQTKMMTSPRARTAWHEAITLLLAAMAALMVDSFLVKLVVAS